jgi:hypothetical protein
MSDPGNAGNSLDTARMPRGLAAEPHAGSEHHGELRGGLGAFQGIW